MGRVRIETQCPLGTLHSLLRLSNEGVEISKGCQSTGVIGIQTNGGFVMNLCFVPATLIAQYKSMGPLGT